MKKEPKNKMKKKGNRESVVDYNPDDVEVGEENPGVKNIRGDLEELEKSRDLNPDDFEE